MPAKKKIAKKATAKPVKRSAKAPAKPVKKTVDIKKAKPAVKAKSAKPAKPAAKKPMKAPAKKPAPKPVKKAVKPQTKSPAKKPAVKATTPAVKASKPAAKPTPVSKPAAKKPAKKSPPPVKKSPPATNKTPAPVKSAKPVAEKTIKPAPAAKAPAAKKEEKAPAAKKEVPTAKKAEAAPAAKAAAPTKAKPANKGTSVAGPSVGFKAGPPIKSVSRASKEEVGATIDVVKNVKVTPFMKKQKGRLIELRSMLLDSMDSVAEGNLRARPEGSEASAFGMHQADAGSDAYDRDFALSLLSQEQDSFHEINEALKRLESGTYGICEMSGKDIPEIRLEALPFTRYTVECQAQLERDNMGGRYRRPVRSLFGLEEGGDGDDDSGDDEETETVDKKEE